MAPERIDGREYSYPSDIWAFGLSLLTVALGRLPIDTKGGYWSILHSIRDSAPPCVPADDLRFSSEFKDFISKCLQNKPEDRWLCHQLLQHPFLRKARREEAGDPEDERRAMLDDLRGIVSTLFVHLENIKLECEKVTPSSQNTKTSEEQKDFQLFFGSLNSVGIAETTRRIMLGHLADRGLLSPRGQSKMAANRLQHLSEQLRLEPAIIAQTIEEICADLSRHGRDESFVRTPRK
jgi:serine/threonine protein kinase